MTMLPSDNEETKVCGQLSALLIQAFEPVGRWFEAHHRRTHAHHSQSHHSIGGGISSSESEEEEEEEDLFDEEDESMILALDPKNVKKQDHYQVLGLSKLRYRASEDQVKRAYKQKVLNHHPDKRKVKGRKVVKDGDDDYFTCITKAYEIIGNKDKRRSFDSVDPEFDDSVPKTDTVTKDNFYNVFRPAFERNARWSLKKRVPKIGDENTSYDEVNHFYSFWYEFNSWREFSYLDEEEKDKGENRDERRWIDKQNKGARQKLKKEEVVRLRSIVDNAYSCDPRVIRFKEEEKERKNAIKKAKADAARQRVEDEEKRKQDIIDEERKKKEAEEAAVKAKNAIIKKEKEALKKQFKKERKALRNSMKEFEYFATNEDDKMINLGEVDRLAEMLSLTSLQSLNEELGKGDKVEAESAFLGKIKEVNDSMEKEKMEQMQMTQTKSSGDSSVLKKQWSEAETTALIKGVNLFPAGTQERWEVIANFMSQHVTACTKTAKDVLGKAKDLQKNDMKLREDAKKNAFAKFEESFKTKKACEMDDPSARVESVGEQQVREVGHNSSTWSPEEQKLLEQSLKSFAASDKDRWDKIAGAVSSRSKKDCMKRYKELCDIVKAKKQAVAANKGKKS